MESVEEWRAVVGYEGLYEVSDLGRVKQLAHVRKHWQGGTSNYPDKIVSLNRNDTGHLIANMTKDGRRRGTGVHRLVLEAFVGPAPEGKPLGLHWDDDPTNNTPDNLRWGSSSDNQRDAIRNGRNPKVNQDRCGRGHLFTPENTYTPAGTIARHCKTCRDSWRARTESPLVHGALSSYTNRRCRCESCLEAHRIYKETKRVVTIAEAKEKEKA